METAGIIIKPVTYSEWASPMVAVPKRDGKVRLCGDFKVSLNPYLQVDKHPLPLIEDVILKVSSGYHLSGEGVRPLESKLRAIEQAPRPTNLTQLRSYLGLLNYYRKFIPMASSILNYYRKFIPMASSILAPLYELGKKDQSFSWTGIKYLGTTLRIGEERPVIFMDRSL
ncbi:hypothetical protein QE152_g38643 [Popillia japonica]|uniref:Reverse transcriptase n=1 Tax=Popillia japonica TaxID=7064 RepID=A0AAW1HWT0_POPJA